LLTKSFIANFIFLDFHGVFHAEEIILLSGKTKYFSSISTINLGMVEGQKKLG
jgi:hypothetical protein